MAAKAGFHALAVSAALVMASGAMQSDHAMAQADEAAAETGVAAAQAGDAAPRERASGQPFPKQKPATADRPAKSDLDRSAARAAPVIRSPRLTRTSTRAIALPKILGSYR